MKVDCHLNLPWVTLEEEESGRRLLPGARRRAGIVLGQMMTPGDKELDMKAVVIVMMIL